MIEHNISLLIDKTVDVHKATWSAYRQDTWDWNNDEDSRLRLVTRSYQVQASWTLPSISINKEATHAQCMTIIYAKGEWWHLKDHKISINHNMLFKKWTILDVFPSILGKMKCLATETSGLSSHHLSPIKTYN